MITMATEYLNWPPIVTYMFVKIVFVIRYQLLTSLIYSVPADIVQGGSSKAIDNVY